MQTGIIMDGVTYRVIVVPDSVKRLAELIEGPNADDMLDDTHESDLTGTKYTYSMHVEPDWINYADYDAFYDAITTPTASHQVTVPYGQTTLTFLAMVRAVEDTLIGKANGVNRWHGMTVTFKPVKCQKEAE